MKTTLLRDFALISTLLTAALAFPMGCETAPGDSRTGSESHFLRACSSDDDCGPLSCLCGVCSSACSDDSPCSELAAEAECVTNATRPSESACPTPPEAMCDLRCTTNADCDSLEIEAECSYGFCREAGGASAGGASAGGAGGSNASGTTDGSGGADSDIAEDGRVELDELCSMYQESACKKQLECEANPGFCDQSHCQQAFGCSGFEALSRAITEGRIAYDPVAAAECYAAVQDDPCGFSYELIVIGMPGLRTLLNACPGVLEAQQNLEATCYGDEECVFGTHCDNELSCPGTCVLDDPPLGDAGDPCDTVIGPNQRCVEPLVCLLGANTESSQQECGEPPQAGDPCTAAIHCRCNGPEALCQTLGCDQSLGECVPRSEVGEPCSLLDATGVPDCLAPAWCDGGFDGGICRPPSAEGEPCSIFSDCLAPLTCIGEVCVPVVGPGATCTFGGDCFRGDCVDLVCEPLAAAGEACELDSDCESGTLCSEGICRVFACPGDACSDERPCLEGRCDSGQCVPWAQPGDACSANGTCSGGPIGELSCLAGLCVDATLCW